MKILLNIATHGDETIGHAVANEIKKLKIIKGEVVVHVANERAYKIRKRFIDQDLNRSFPGDLNGNYEQVLAAKILPFIKEFDVVIDIHSTTSELKDALIVTKLDKKTRQLINIVGPKYLLYMKITKDNALISNAKIGIAFEYGKDTDPKTIKKTALGIENILAYYNMIDKKIINTKYETKYFEVYKAVNKPKDAKLLKSVTNFKLIKKGQTYAMLDKVKITAEEDFYPILFGEKKYENYFGFVGKLLE